MPEGLRTQNRLIASGQILPCGCCSCVTLCLDALRQQTSAVETRSTHFLGEAAQWYPPGQYCTLAHLIPPRGTRTALTNRCLLPSMDQGVSWNCWPGMSHTEEVIHTCPRDTNRSPPMPPSPPHECQELLDQNCPSRQNPHAA